MKLLPLEECKRRFAIGMCLASVVILGPGPLDHERVSRFGDGYRVSENTLDDLFAEHVCWFDPIESDDCVKVFVATPSFLQKIGAMPSSLKKKRAHIEQENQG